MLNLDYPDPKIPGVAPKDQPGRKLPEGIPEKGPSLGYRGFVFFLDHWVKILFAWIGLASAVSILAGRSDWASWSVVLPVFVLVGLCTVVFAALWIGGFITRFLR